MSERILRLCKRLGKFSFEDIYTVAEDIEQSILESELDILINKNIIRKIGDMYLYNKCNVSNKKNRQNVLFLQYHSKEQISLFMKCFCAEIPTTKTAILMELSKNTISTIYSFLRKILYKIQYNKLKTYYEKNPKIPSVRSLYKMKIYMYNYNNEMFLTDKPLKSVKPEVRHTKNEMRDMNVAYYRIRRVFLNYAYTKSIAETAYEKLWMQDKTQECKLELLKDALKS